MSTGKNMLEALAALATLALIAWLLALVDATTAIFWATSAATVLFYAACYLFPDLMTGLVSMPSAFRLDENLGVDSLEMQSVTYASYHTNWFSNTTHAGFVVDGIAWYVLTFAFLGPIGAAVLLGWQVYQARTYREPRFTLGLLLTWGAVAALAYSSILWLGEATAVDWAMFGLVSMGLWRFVGHAAEPIPPGVAGNDRFASMRDVEIGPKIVVTAVLGYVAEFAAGLPFRLLNFWVYAVMVKVFGFRPTTTIDLAEIEAQRDSIHENGWSGGRSTSHLAGRTGE